MFDLTNAIRELRAANLLTVTPARDSVGDDQYRVTQIGNLYIRNYFSPQSAEQERIRNKQQQLSYAKEHSASAENVNIYNLNYIFIRKDHDDHVAAEYLRMCMDYMSREDSEAAERYLSKAKDMSPNYFEVHRVEAFLAFKENNLLRAEDS